jgi:hypothetical protein
VIKASGSANLPRREVQTMTTKQTRILSYPAKQK